MQATVFPTSCERWLQFHIEKYFTKNSNLQMLTDAFDQVQCLSTATPFQSLKLSQVIVGNTELILLWTIVKILPFYHVTCCIVSCLFCSIQRRYIIYFHFNLLNFTGLFDISYITPTLWLVVAGFIITWIINVKHLGLDHNLVVM